MARFSRRDFIKSLSVAMGAITANQFLTACGANSASMQSAETTDTTSPVEKPVENLAETPAEVKSSTSPDLVVTRNGDPETLVRQAMAALGGMERFVPKGARVIVKPNICVAYHSYEYAATTNPWVVGALVKLAFEAGASNVQVTDYPFGGSPDEAYVRSGIAEQVKAAGGEMLLMPRFKFVSTSIPDGIDLKETEIFEDALKADVLIDVPIAKHHSLARLTLGMKNLMGVIRNRTAIHHNLGQRLADLTSLVHPTLTIVDAVRILMDHGPTGGNLDDVKQMDTVIASPDIVAADSYAATLFGLQPDDISYVRAGAAMGLGRNDLKNLNIEEITIGV